MSEISDTVLMLEAMSEIRGLHDKTNTDAKGIIVCPKCGKKLGYSVSGFNGHIWGKCETENCLSWMM